MEWWQARESMKDSDCIRLSHWDEDKFIYEDVIILDNKDNMYIVAPEEKASNKWEVYNVPAIEINYKNDYELHYIVNCGVMAKLIYLKNKLDKSLICFADKHNSLPSWGHSSGLKYNIVYSHISNDYIIEGTWGHDNIGCVYFNDKQVCESALKQYRYLMDNIIELNCLYGKLHNDKFERHELETLYNTYCL